MAVFCIWGNRGIGDVFFYLPSINSIVKKDPNSAILIPQPIWSIGKSVKEILPKNVVLIPNLPKTSPLVKNRINAVLREDQEYWSGKIAAKLLRPYSIDFLITTRNYNPELFKYKTILNVRGSQGHESDRFGEGIQKAGITYLPLDFSLAYSFKKRRNGRVLLIQQSGRAEKDLPKSLIDKIHGSLSDSCCVDVLPRFSEGFKFRDFVSMGQYLAKYSLVIGPDTGLIHYADALGIRCIGIFTTTNPKRYGPKKSLDLCLELKGKEETEILHKIYTRTRRELDG